MSKFNIKERFLETELAEFGRKWLNLNRWTIFSFVLVISLATVFYVNNVVKVSYLMKKVQTLKKVKQESINLNKIYEAELIKLQSAERITFIAETKLMMTKASKAPINLH
ncbi:MAG: hypothetical protein NTW25_07995 [Candidatus Kapabacteria bacterium]|jgi:hypothetical protein|nr:hypothetical protein [Candidatus Kapabacteria bacterium]